MTHIDEGYGDFEAEKDREFCVRDIPPNVDDWAVFHVFKRFGIVDNVRFPVNQPADSPRFCFVSMINHEGASNVRSVLNNGKLNVGNHTLRVSDARGAGVQNKKQSYNVRTNQPHRSGHNNNNNRRSGENIPKAQKIVYPTADLPLGVPVSVRVVPSPFSSDGSNGLTFHVLNISKVPSEAYTELQQAMNTHCHNNDNACGSVEIGGAVMFYRQEVAYRAIQNKPDTVYLVDMGKEERIVSGRLFRMLQRFAVLPALVITCSLARVQWTKPNNELFNSIIEKWCDSEGSLTARVEYFVGGTNMIHLEGSAGTNLAKSLAKRGDLIIIEKMPEFVYSRDEMYRIGMEAKIRPLPIAIDRHAEAILQITKAVDDIVV